MIAAAGAIAAAAALAACGSSGGTSSSAAAGTSPATSTGNVAASSTGSSSGPAATVSTTSSSHGTYLTASGRAVYLWVADKGGQSVCSGTCAKVWPPLLTKGSPKAATGAVAGDLGTITRPDGTQQVTYKGHPLYFYITDTGPGMTSGQGSNSFGAKWWLLTPSGAAITGGGSSGSSSAASTGSGGNGWG